MELMKKRYKVVADFPDSSWNIGDIIPAGEDEISTGEYDRYPAIFRPLAWYEERTQEEMNTLRFVRVIRDNGSGILPDQVFPIDGIINYPRGMAIRCNEWRWDEDYPVNLTPATEAEYLTYKNEK